MKNTSVKEFFPEEKLVQEAIHGVLEKEGRAHINCTDPQKDGTFAPLIGIDGHFFKASIFYDKQNISLEMCEELMLSERELEDFRNKIKRADSSQAMFETGEKWMRFYMTTRPENFMIIGIIPINIESGKEKIAEIFRKKFRSMITTIMMLNLGMFNDEPRKVMVRLTPS
jgi:hypothetical protein